MRIFASGARQRRQDVFSGIASFVRDQRGAALIELAAVLPFLLILYLGGFVLADNIARMRKVTIATRTLADLVAQSASGTTSAAEVDGELSAATLVLAPYATAPSSLRISEIYVDQNLNATVKWSRALRGTANPVGAAFSLNKTLQLPRTYVLVADVSYAYTPPLALGFIQPKMLVDHLLMLPRNAASVDCGDC